MLDCSLMEAIFLWPEWRVKGLISNPIINGLWPASVFNCNTLRNRFHLSVRYFDWAEEHNWQHHAKSNKYSAYYQTKCTPRNLYRSSSISESTCIETKAQQDSKPLDSEEKSGWVKGEGEEEQKCCSRCFDLDSSEHLQIAVRSKFLASKRLYRWGKWEGEGGTSY